MALRPNLTSFKFEFMPTLYKRYLEIKDKFCIAYFGVFSEFIVQLLYLRPAIEAELPGIQIYIVCSDELKRKYNQERMVGRSEFQDYEYSHVREITFDSTSHPVFDLIESSKLTLEHLPPVILPTPTKKCVLLNQALPPVAKIDDERLKTIKQYIVAQGYYIEEDGDLDNAGWVVGIESEKLYQAATRGIRTSLVPTGFGTKLFQKMFPHNEILQR